MESVIDYWIIFPWCEREPPT